MNDFTLRQMRIFCAVGDHRTLAAAGRVLGLSPATISDALRDLEAALGKLLFDRSRRNLRLSSTGKAMLPDAKKLLRDADRVMQRHGRRSVLRIGASVTVGNYILPPLLSEFSNRNPETEIIVEIRNTDDIVGLLLDHDIELAVVEGLVAHPDLLVSPWRKDPLVVIAAPDHALAGATDAARLFEASWVLREHGSGTRQTFDIATAKWAGAPQVALTVGGNELLKVAVRRGVGLGCLSASAVAGEVERGELVIVPVRLKAMERTLSIVQRTRDTPHRIARTFIEACSASIEPGSVPCPARPA